MNYEQWKSVTLQNLISTCSVTLHFRIRQQKGILSEKKHENLVEKFLERLREWQKLEDKRLPDNPWVVPFMYDFDEEGVNQKGGLWVPDIDIQRTVHNVGHLIHYLLVEDMEVGVEELGIHPLRGNYF